MSEEKYVPQGKICNYLINQDDNELLEAYHKQFVPHHTPHDPCWNMASHFISMGKDEFEGIAVDEISFYKALRLWASSELTIYGYNYTNDPKDPEDFQIWGPSYPQLDFLNFLNHAELKIFCPNLENIQKWHLFVSVFAYSLICKHYSEDGQSNPVENSFNFSDSDHFWRVQLKSFPSYELKLWMIENAERRYDSRNTGTIQKKLLFDKIKAEIEKDKVENQNLISKSKTGKLIKKIYAQLFGLSSDFHDEEIVDKCREIREDIMKESTAVRYLRGK